jgi:hypothetical protein
VKRPDQRYIPDEKRSITDKTPMRAAETPVEQVPKEQGRGGAQEEVTHQRTAVVTSTHHGAPTDDLYNTYGASQVEAMTTDDLPKLRLGRMKH